MGRPQQRERERGSGQSLVARNWMHFFSAQKRSSTSDPEHNGSLPSAAAAEGSSMSSEDSEDSSSTESITVTEE